MRHHKHVEGQDLTWSHNTGWSYESFLSGGFTCNELKIFVGKTSADLLELVLSYALFLFPIQFELCLVNVTLYVVVRQFVGGEILQGLLDWREPCEFLLVGFGQEAVTFILLLVTTFNQLQLFLGDFIAAFHRCIEDCGGFGVPN